MPATYPFSRRPADPPHCRSPRCGFPRAGTLGFCIHCEAIYRAALALRARRLDAYAARLRVLYPEHFTAMAPANRRSLLAHLAAHGVDGGRGDTGLDLLALDDFFAECLKRDGEVTG
jgi:hypothetical protein